MLAFLSFLFFVVGVALTYWLFIGPLLRQRPQFADFYARSDSFWQAAWAKFSTVKTKMASILLGAASALVGLHDFLLPVATGIDWTPVTAMVPSWSWPIISFAIAVLFYWLRVVTAKRQEEVVAAVADGIPPAQAEMMIPGQEKAS